jgi:hypothetical protein
LTQTLILSIYKGAAFIMERKLCSEFVIGEYGAAVEFSENANKGVCYLSNKLHGFERHQSGRGAENAWKSGRGDVAWLA